METKKTVNTSNNKPRKSKKTCPICKKGEITHNSFMSVCSHCGHVKGK